MTLDCIFCDWKNEEVNKVFAENELFYARWDNIPLTEGHTEIVPKKHVDSFFDLSKEEVASMFDLAFEVKQILNKMYKPDAYNMFINDGEEAGRTVHHLHFHIIPRYEGDFPDIRGGLRKAFAGHDPYLD